MVVDVQAQAQRVLEAPGSERRVGPTAWSRSLVEVDEERIAREDDARDLRGFTPGGEVERRATIDARAMVNCWNVNAETAEYAVVTLFDGSLACTRQKYDPLGKLAVTVTAV